LTVEHPTIEGFWRFCSLRQEAYWLRQRGQRHPDPAFRYHFCNVYREADKGTVWFRRESEPRLHGDRLEKLVDLIWFSVAYRLVNRLDTFEEFGGLPPREDKLHWLRFLEERMRGGHKVFTGRHLNVGFSKYRGALDHLDENMLGNGVTLGIADSVRNALYLKQVVQAVERIPGVGTFFGWQVTCDLTEAGRLDVCDSDKWVHLGPGAWNALKLIYPGARRADSVRQAVELWQTQRYHVVGSMEKCEECGGTGKIHSHNDICDSCDRRGRWILDPPPQAPGPMSLKNVEHALCEYARYVRVISTPEGKGVGLEVKKW